MSIDISLIGLSGSPYPFRAYSYSGEWLDVGGIYAFAQRSLQGGWRILYVGKADSFRNRMCNHEKWGIAQVMGATHVLAHVNRNEASRCAEESDLIRRYCPPLNTQHNQLASLSHSGRHGLRLGGM